MLASYFPLALAACSNSSDRHNSDSVGEFATIGTAAQLKAKGYLLNKKLKVLVVQQDSELMAVNPVCTHRGCIVDWDKSSGTLVCPCHNAKFSIEGKVLAKPATKPLSTYEVKEDNGGILVKLA
jgi:cytochrome b6-f complex iron-sulfur subunit